MANSLKIIILSALCGLFLAFSATGYSGSTGSINVIVSLKAATPSPSVTPTPTPSVTPTPYFSYVLENFSFEEEPDLVYWTVTAAQTEKSALYAYDSYYSCVFQDPTGEYLGRYAKSNFMVVTEAELYDFSGYYLVSFNGETGTIDDTSALLRVEWFSETWSSLGYYPSAGWHLETFGTWERKEYSEVTAPADSKYARLWAACKEVNDPDNDVYIDYFTFSEYQPTPTPSVTPTSSPSPSVTPSTTPTPTPEVISVYLNMNDWDIGTIGLSETEESVEITATNDGNVIEDFTINCENGAGDWTIQSAVGEDSFTVKADVFPYGGYDITLEDGTTPVTLATGVGAADTVYFKLQYSAPSGNTKVSGIPQDFDITITAIKH